MSNKCDINGLNEPSVVISEKKKKNHTVDDHERRGLRDTAIHRSSHLVKALYEQ